MEIKLTENISLEQLQQIGKIVAESNKGFCIIELGQGILSENNQQAFRGITVGADLKAIDSAINFLELIKASSAS